MKAKAMIRHVDDHGSKYDALAFVCPGCVEMVGGSGLHLLPVNSATHSPSWGWDGNLYLPTVTPSILTGKDTDKVCHSFLTAGVFQFLGDCNHSLANKNTLMVDLPEWFIKEIEE